MSSAQVDAPLPPEAFIERLRSEGAARYHDGHPFHVAMHAGQLSKPQLQQWVLNRYYYQTRIPIKDALILAKSEDPGFRRLWIARIHDHDGPSPDEGGLSLWLRLSEGVGLDRAEVASCAQVLPGVRFACDAYVELVRSGTLLEAVASSLTECFAPDLMSQRIAAFERHYPWIEPVFLDYFRGRVTRARADAQVGLRYIRDNAHTLELQARCLAALRKKTEVLWHLLDCVQSAHGPLPKSHASAV